MRALVCVGDVHMMHIDIARRVHAVQLEANKSMPFLIAFVVVEYLNTEAREGVVRAGA